MTKPYKVPCKNCGVATLKSATYAYKCSFCKNPYAAPHGWTTIRKAIIKRDNNCCTLCGDTKKLHVHHKDINRRNNNFNNLITLCSQCHISQHGKKFEQPIDIVWGKFGKRLTYQSNNFYSIPKSRLPITRFKRNNISL